MNKITYFHRNLLAGYSINKVTQTIIKDLKNKEEFYVPQRGAGILDIIKNIIFIFKHRNKKGINHITGDIHYGILGLIGCKSILTIHDTGYLAQYNIVKRYIFNLLWYKLPLIFATKVVCISEETKKCVERFTKRKDIIVIHNAVDDSIKECSENKRCNQINDILIIGTAPNKNIDTMIEAVAGLHVKLHIVGSLSDNQINRLKQLNICFEKLQNISDEDINNLYHSCDLLLFCSLFEGFGMLVIEANKAGCLVVASNLSVLKEVGGDSALYVDPHSVVDIRNAILRLSIDISLRCELLKNGMKNVKRFSPNIIRKQWIELYKQFGYEC